MERAPFGCLPTRPTRPTCPTRAWRRPGGATARERRENRGDLCIIPHLWRHFRYSGLVMCVSTLPSPSLSVPCIWGILQSPCRKSGALSAKDHFAKVFPNAHAFRSRRGEAQEGSPVFSPDVEGRSPKDSGKEELGKDIRPRQGVALTQSVNQCDTLAGSRIASEAGSTGLRGYAP